MLHRNNQAKVFSIIISKLKDVASQHPLLLAVVVLLVAAIALLKGYDINLDEDGIELKRQDEAIEQYRIPEDAQGRIRWGIRKKEGEDPEINIDWEKLF